MFVWRVWVLSHVRQQSVNHISMVSLIPRPNLVWERDYSQIFVCHTGSMVLRYLIYYILVCKIFNLCYLFQRGAITYVNTHCH